MMSSFARRTQRLLLTLVLLVPSVAAAGETFTDKQFHFTMTVPGGFVRWNHPEPTPVTIHDFIRYPATADDNPIILRIERLEGTIPDGDHLKDLPGLEQMRGKTWTHPWRDIEVDIMEVEHGFGPWKASGFIAQMPLKREAVQIIITGPTAKRTELKALLYEIVEDFEGETNWKAGGSQERERRFKTTYITLFAVMVIGGLIGLWLLSKVVPRGVVLAIAVGIYAASWAFEPATRIEKGLTGATRMLGVGAILLGIIDLCHKRKPKAPKMKGIKDAEHGAPPLPGMPDDE